MIRWQHACSFGKVAGCLSGEGVLDIEHVGKEKVKLFDLRIDFVMADAKSVN